MAPSSGEGGGGEVDGHRYTISPSGIIQLYVSRADGGARRYVIKSRPGGSVKSVKERMRAKLKAEGALQIFQKGWTVVHCHWFSFKRVHPAGSSNCVYFALEEETLFNMQSMIRLYDIRFQQALPRRSRVTSPEWYKNECTLADDVYQKLINSL
jgi:hypothetical protein